MGLADGETVLNMPAQVLRETSRPVALLARTIGNEFAALLPATTPDLTRR